MNDLNLQPQSIDQQDANDEVSSTENGAGSQMAAQLKPFVEMLDDSRFKLRLAYKVKHGEQDVEFIEGRRPQGRHMRQFPVGGGTRIEDLVNIFQSCTGTPKVVIDQLDASDLMRTAALIGFFMLGGQLTGPR